MPPRIRLFYVAMTFVTLVLAALPLFKEMTRPRDIWWTPPSMMVPVTQGSDRVEVYARGELLGSLLMQGRLQVLDQDKANTLVPADVALRFNNWDRVRAERMPWLAVDAAICGMMLTLLLLVASGRLAWRNET